MGGIFCASTIAMLGFGLRYNHTFGAMSDLAMGGFLAFVAYHRFALFEKIKELAKGYIILIYILGLTAVYFQAYGYPIRIIVTLFMAFVIFEQCFASNSLVKMVRFKRISYLGTSTYGLYLLHTISNFISSNMLSKLGVAKFNPYFADLVVQPLASLTLTLILVYLSFRFFERPFLNLEHKFSLINTRRSE